MLTSIATGSSLARMQPHQCGKLPIGPSPSPAIKASQTHKCGRRDRHDVHELAEHVGRAVVRLPPLGIDGADPVFGAPLIG